MKKLRKCTAFVVAVIIVFSLNAPAFASTNDAPSIEYLQDEGRYLVKNIDPQRILDVFEDNEDLVLVDSDEDTTESRAITGPFNRTYETYDTIYGIYNEPVRINYTILVKMDFITINETKYQYFVEVLVGSNGALESNSYRLADGTSNVVYEIKAMGSQLALTQIVQLEATTTTSVDVSGSIGGWASVGISTGGEYIYRNTPQLCQKTIVLPLYNVLF